MALLPMELVARPQMDPVPQATIGEVVDEFAVQPVVLIPSSVIVFGTSLHPLCPINQWMWWFLGVELDLVFET